MANSLEKYRYVKSVQCYHCKLQRCKLCLYCVVTLEYIINLLICHRPRGPMDKASAHGAGDCRFESYRGHFLFLTSCCGHTDTQHHDNPYKISILAGGFGNELLHFEFCNTSLIPQSSIAAIVTNRCCKIATAYKLISRYVDHTFDDIGCLV